MNDRPSPSPLPLAGQTAERSDAAANRRRILQAARRLLVEQGPGAVSMDAVAAAAGVGKGTIFRRFGDRSGLTEALIDEYMRDFQDAFLGGPPPLGPGAPPAERLRAFMVALVRLQHDNLPIAIAAELPSGGAILDAYAPLHVHLRLLVEALDRTLDADVIATMLLGATSPPVLDRLLRVRGSSLDTITTSVTALVDGITGRHAT